MRAINHAMTGAIIGLAIANPVALPLAVASHFLIDIIPHHEQKRDLYTTPIFRIMLGLDVILCISLVTVLTIKHPKYWWLAAACAFVAASPDLMWVRDFIADHRGKPRPPRKHPVMLFHDWVQWFQKPVGIIVELAWAVLCLALLSSLLVTT